MLPLRRSTAGAEGVEIRYLNLGLMRYGVWVATVFLLAGCAGAGTSATGGSNGPPGEIHPCPTIAHAAKLLAPLPGATSVPTTIGNIEVGNSLGTSPIVVTLTATGGTAIVQSDIPVPSADQQGANLAIPVLASKTTYTVSLADTGVCHALVTAPIGMFTTQ